MNYDNDFGIKHLISIVRSQACQALPMESFPKWWLHSGGIPWIIKQHFIIVFPFTEGLFNNVNLGGLGGLGHL